MSPIRMMRSSTDWSERTVLTFSSGISMVRWLKTPSRAMTRSLVRTK
jgi:hypothetical protein